MWMSFEVPSDVMCSSQQEGDGEHFHHVEIHSTQSRPTWLDLEALTCGSSLSLRDGILVKRAAYVSKALFSVCWVSGLFLESMCTQQWSSTQRKAPVLTGTWCVMRLSEERGKILS